MSEETAVTNWREDLAKMAKEVGESEQPSGSFITFRSGIMSYNGASVPGNKIHCVIMDSVFENDYYPDKFNPNATVSPTCFAIARTDAELAPHENSPIPQNKVCDGCPQNDWGSDPDGGKGKACKNTRRLSLIHADFLKSPEEIGKAEVVYTRIPVTSVRNWSQYANQISTVLKVPPMGVITELAVVPDPKTQFQVIFKMVNAIQDDVTLSSLVARRKALADSIMFPYAKVSAPEPGGAPQADTKKVGSKKF